MNEKDIKQFMRECGKKGGMATVSKYGNGYMKELAKKSAEKRKENKAKIN